MYRLNSVSTFTIAGVVASTLFGSTPTKCQANASALMYEVELMPRSFRPTGFLSDGVLVGRTVSPLGQEVGISRFENGVASDMPGATSAFFGSESWMLSPSGEVALTQVNNGALTLKLYRTDGTSTIQAVPSSFSGIFNNVAEHTDDGRTLIAQSGAAAGDYTIFLDNGSRTDIADFRGMHIVADGSIAGTRRRLGANGAQPTETLIWSDGRFTVIGPGELGLDLAPSAIEAQIWPKDVDRNGNMLLGLRVLDAIPTDDVHKTFLRNTNGSIQEVLSPLGQQYGAAAHALNSRGDLVGASYTRDPLIGPTSQGMVWRNGQGYLLDELTTTSGWSIYNAFDIDESGRIIAENHSRSEGVQFLLLSPVSVPEPGVTILVSATICLTLTRRRNRRTI
jgi:hypothetical protein